MELVEVNRLDPQRPQRSLKLTPHARRGELIRPVQEPVEAMAELGRHDPPRPVMAAEVIADQALREVVAIAFRSVNEIDPEFGGLIEDRVRLSLGKGAAPLAAKLPGAQADNRHTQASAAENSIVA